MPIDPTYEPHPDFSPTRPMWNVTTTTGQVLPMALSEEQLQAAGVKPKAPANMAGPSIVEPPAEVPDERLAQEGASPKKGYVPLIDRLLPDFSERMARTPKQMTPAIAGAMTPVQLDKPAPQKPAPAQPTAPTRPLVGAPEQATQPVDPTAALRAQFKGRSYKIPGGVQETARRVSGVQPMDKEYAGQIDETAQAQKEAALTATMLEKQGLEAQALQLEQFNTEQREELERKQARRVQINAEINSRMDSVEARRAEYAASGEVDPQRYFKSLGSVGGALAAIGLIATSFASGFKGERNPVMDLYQSNVERDLAIQREQLAKKRDAITGEENALARFMQIHGDPQMAENEFRLHALDIAERQAKVVATRAQSQIAEANYASTLVDIDAKRNELLANMRAQATGVVDRQFQVTPDRSGYVSGDEQYLKVLEREGKIVEAEKKAGLREDGGSPETAVYWPGTGKQIGNVATTPEKAEEVRKTFASAATIDRLAESTARRMRDWDDLNPSERGKLVADAGALMLEMKGPAGADLGVLAGPDLDVLDSVVVANPGSLGNAATRSMVVDKLLQTQRNVRAKGDMFARAHGLGALPWDSGNVGEAR